MDGGGSGEPRLLRDRPIQNSTAHDRPRRKKSTVPHRAPTVRRTSQKRSAVEQEELSRTAVPHAHRHMAGTRWDSPIASREPSKRPTATSAALRSEIDRDERTHQFSTPSLRGCAPETKAGRGGEPRAGRMAR